MSTFKLEYLDSAGKRKEEPVSAALLIPRLDELERELPAEDGLGAIITNEFGNYLCVGLKKTEGVLVFVEEKDNFPETFLVSLGRPQATGDYVDFYLLEHTPVSPKCLVSREILFEVLRQWIKDGKLSSLIEWTTTPL
jgi:hypothetical protein